MNLKPHILIDARLYGPTHTGIGRYVQNLLKHLINQPLFSRYQWSLLAYPELVNQIQKDLSTNYKIFSTTIRHYTLREQLLLPLLLHKIKPDLVHIPHFNKPVLYFGKTVVTIHDLIKHFSKGKDTTTRNSILYWPKYFVYLLLTRLVIKHNHLIVPSLYWQNYIINHFNSNPSKIITTHEAVDPVFQNQHHLPIIAPKKYLLYSGNLYPHKNIIVVLKALQKMPQLKLKIISKPNIFLQRTQELVAKLILSNQVEFLGFLDDSKFAQIHRQALAFVFPTLMEGFGLPGLEAQALGCPVISSNTSCLPEIYQDSVLYFNPHDPQSLIDQIKLLSNSSLRTSLITKGYLQVKKYSWHQTAKLTLNYYEKILSHA